MFIIEELLYGNWRIKERKRMIVKNIWIADTLKQLRPIGKGEQVLEERLDQKELT
jgi:hypothetical protein